MVNAVNSITPAQAMDKMERQLDESVLDFCTLITVEERAENLHSV
jgi:hypothetical protein